MDTKSEKDNWQIYSSHLPAFIYVYETRAWTWGLTAPSMQIHINSGADCESRAGCDNQFQFVGRVRRRMSCVSSVETPYNGLHCNSHNLRVLNYE